MLQVIAIDKVFVSCIVKVAEGKKLNGLALSGWCSMSKKFHSVRFHTLGGKPQNLISLETICFSQNFLLIDLSMLD